ncbi:MAG: sulfurtransferase [Stagnimonas sp.]|nr:sulfurtransferase [Stagnimonas sp.]
MSVLNIAAYRFVSIGDLPALKSRLAAAACGQGLKGTVLLAQEGINLFLAGSPEGIEAFIAVLAADARFAGLPIKRSVSATQPFKKLLVKIKPEIITLRQPQVNPALTPAPSVAPQVLKQWLDQGHDDAGRALVLLDTRNAFEVEQGTFDGAVHPDIEKFSDYPAHVGVLGDLKDKTVVTFCTGGIRCEKAAPWMLQAGYENVVQLEGGILKYFEDCGSAHYTGGCFVFDERRALDGELQPMTTGDQTPM